MSWAAEPVASERPAAAAILDYLSGLTNEDRTTFVCGQNLGHGNYDPQSSYQDNVGRLHEVSARWPGILAVDYGFDEIPYDLGDCTQLMAKHFRQGGLVTASMHPGNPWRQSEAHDRRIGDVKDLWNPDSAAYAQWRRDLTRIAVSLAELSDQGVVVLWRPLHEMNGGWFWWGRDKGRRGLSAEEYVRLWKELFEFFTVERKLNNLLWVYSPAVQTGPEMAPVLDYYPGDQYVDVVALDWYDDRYEGLDAHGSYTQLASLQKPMGLAEVGPLKLRDGSFDNLTLLQRLRAAYPRLGFFVFWHSWPGAKVAIVDHRRPAELMQHELVIDRDELPEFGDAP
jgi:mannan endo-1,4-beta-mannosidase